MFWVLRGAHAWHGGLYRLLRCFGLKCSELSQQLSDSVIIKSSLVFKEHGAQALLVSDCIWASCIDCIDPPSFHRAGLAGTLQSCETPDESDGEISRPLPLPIHLFLQWESLVHYWPIVLALNTCQPSRYFREIFWHRLSILFGECNSFYYIHLALYVRASMHYKTHLMSVLKIRCQNKLRII